MAQDIVFKWDDGAIRHLLQDDVVPRAVEKAAGKTRDRAKGNIRSAGRIDTGALLNSIISKRVSSGGALLWYEIFSDLPYAIYQHNGVKGPIYPRRARVLRFKPKGSSEFIFRPSVSGFEGVPYLTDALNQLSVSDFT